MALVVTDASEEENTAEEVFTNSKVFVLFACDNTFNMWKFKDLSLSTCKGWKK